MTGGKVVEGTAYLDTELISQIWKDSLHRVTIASDRVTIASGR
jgi:hypothetical protein